MEPANNFKIRDEKCGCTGSRSCLICEAYRTDKFMIQKTGPTSQRKIRAFVYCPDCGTKSWSAHLSNHLHHVSENSDDSISIDGIHLFEEVISLEEEATIVAKIDETNWVNSQSGRRKQDYGPRINFKKKKLNADAFRGLPVYVKDVWNRLSRTTVRFSSS